MAASAFAMPLTNGSIPMKPDARMGGRLGDQMLAAAEADFEPHVVDGSVETARAGRPAARVEIERQPRQQRLEQRRLPRAQRMALAPAEEGAVSSWLVLDRHAERQPRCPQIMSATAAAGIQ